MLVVDLDPQASLTWAVGIDTETLELSLHDVLLRRAKASDVLVKVGDLHVIPSSIDLAGAEVHLLTKTGREYVLRRALEPVIDDYDLVLIDCPPSLGILTINGLTAADRGAHPAAVRDAEPARAWASCWRRSTTCGPTPTRTCG